jgi:hypothetical protein
MRSGKLFQQEKERERNRVRNTMKNKPKGETETKGREERSLH